MNLISPEFHGREHVNARRFLELIKKKSELGSFMVENECVPVLRGYNEMDYLKSYSDALLYYLDFIRPGTLAEAASSLSFFNEFTH